MAADGPALRDVSARLRRPLPGEVRVLAAGRRLQREVGRNAIPSYLCRTYPLVSVDFPGCAGVSREITFPIPSLISYPSPGFPAGSGLGAKAADRFTIDIGHARGYNMHVVHRDGAFHRDGA